MLEFSGDKYVNLHKFFLKDVLPWQSCQCCHHRSIQALAARKVKIPILKTELGELVELNITLSISNEKK